MERLIGFAPSIDENCTTIILGSKIGRAHV